MGGVDKFNQQLHYQHTLRKSYEWYRRLALKLTSGSQKVYVPHTGSNTVFLDFMHNTVASRLASTPKIKILDVQIPDDTRIRHTCPAFLASKKSYS